MQIIKPKRLQKGDTVMIVSPSGGVPKELKGQFNNGVKFLESLGLKVKTGKNALGRYYYSSGTAEERLRDIHEAFADKSVKAVIMSIGGSTANNLLDGLDFDLIKNNPKIFSGISDGTTLLNPIFSKTGLITYHGPDLIFTFGEPMSAIIKENLIKTWLEGNVGKLQPNSDWKGLDKLNENEKYEGWQCVRKGKTKGKLIGGNITCLVNLENTAFKPDYRGAILFLESYMYNIAAIDQAFTHFRQAGIFDKINGVILGHFYGSHMEDKSQDRKAGEVFLEVAKDYSFPILEIGELGHCVENYIFPIGCKATIDAENKYFSIDEKTVY
ncbi:LD-carboxypeptidase [Patescibacteria group bacterium]|nr:LD-carboxypeptidase [Patescibacteria group bacterium]MBU4057188.1 LD-carboxypeptidase [Patescibacteria group bacterium]MBU4368763.1 LD-carboxypeptidase [Patescibacteria group bacterium]